jgi:hypothetical protein
VPVHNLAGHQVFFADCSLQWYILVAVAAWGLGRGTTATAATVAHTASVTRAVYSYPYCLLSVRNCTHFPHELVVVIFKAISRSFDFSLKRRK